MATKKATGTTEKKATTKSAAKAPAKSAAKTPAKAASKKSAAPEQKVPTHQQIAELAHRYWIERGRPHGSHQEDWFRAEETLRNR